MSDWSKLRVECQSQVIIVEELSGGSRICRDLVDDSWNQTTCTIRNRRKLGCWEPRPHPHALVSWCLVSTASIAGQLAQHQSDPISPASGCCLLHRDQAKLSHKAARCTATNTLSNTNVTTGENRWESARSMTITLPKPMAKRDFVWSFGVLFSLCATFQALLRTSKPWRPI